MSMTQRYMFPFLLLLAMPAEAKIDEWLKKSVLSGSMESNSILYVNDPKLGVDAPADRFGSNNYLKIDYSIGNLAMGLMYEAYLPVLQGFPTAYNDSDFTTKYLSYTTDSYELLMGNFYDQFGSGLIFRAYEDRQLGFNNSIQGFRAAYRYKDLFGIKGFAGRPRYFMELSETQLRGADVNFSLSSLFKDPQFGLNLELSYINKYDAYSGTSSYPESMDAYSYRLAFDLMGAYAKGEYIIKTSDPSAVNQFLDEKGEALLVEAGYIGANFGGHASFRALKYMGITQNRDTYFFGEELNYIPSLTRQYTYSLANINPYAAQSNGEIGGQVDLYINLDRGSFFGGKYGTKVGMNFSTYYNLKGDPLRGVELGFGDKLLFRDINVDLTKKLSRSVKMTLLYANQVYNPIVVGYDKDLVKSHLAVADVQVRLSRKYAIRAEVQHLAKDDKEGNWIAALAELSIVPSWTIFAADMLDYQGKKTHYYQAGFSYSKRNIRAELSYSRNRAGYTCAGGVCRLTPAYTGCNLRIFASF